MLSVLTAQLGRGEQIILMARADLSIAPARVHGVRDRARRFLRLAVLGRSTYAAVTDRRLVVTETKPKAEPVLSVQFDTLCNVETDRHRPVGPAGVGYGPPEERVNVKIETADKSIRLAFSKPWLDEGEEIGRRLRAASPS